VTAFVSFQIVLCTCASVLAHAAIRETKRRGLMLRHVYAVGT
jgi:hypothetical protein